MIFPVSPHSEFDTSPPFTQYWQPAGYAVFGFHGSGDSTGVTLSLPDNSAIVQGATWDTLIKPINHLTEQGAINGPISLVAAPESFANGLLDLIKIPYGTQATLVNFTTASFGGTAIASVPEPATLVLLAIATAATILVVPRRDS